MPFNTPTLTPSDSVVTYGLTVRPETEWSLIIIIDKLPLEVRDP